MEKKQKIIHILNDIKRGGAQMVALNILAGLTPERWDRTLVCLYAHDPTLTIEDIVREKDIPLQVLGATKGSMADAVRKLYRYLSHEQPHVLHCHLPHAALVGITAGILARVPTIIVHEHNTHAFLSWKLRALLRLLRPFVRLTICYSDTVEAELFHDIRMLFAPPEAWPHRSCTILNGVDLEGIDAARATVQKREKRNELGIAADAFVIMSVARIVAWKGQRELVRAFAQVASAYPKALLVLVGDGEMREETKRLAAELGVGARVLFAGVRRDVFELLMIADIYSAVYIYPPEAKGKGEESMGIATLEAMGAGLPTIAADYPSVYKFITPGKNGLLAKPGDVEDLAERLRTLLADETTRKRIGTAGAAFVKGKLAWPPLIAIYQKLYMLLA